MKIGLIGCGKMGTALIEGILQGNASTDTYVGLCDNYAPSAESLLLRIQSQNCEANVYSDVNTLLEKVDTLLLCVKPNDVKPVLSSGKNWNEKLILSIAAGISTEQLESHTGGLARIIRVMPNTPALIGEGASAFCRGKKATDDDAEIAKALLASVGTVCQVKESLMDAVTGLSGSGPAYGYLIIEALSDAGVKKGLPREVALELACQTMKGAAMMVQNTGLHPALLKDQVTSPGGTTITGLAELEEKGLRSALIAAVEKATEKSIDLGKSE